MNMQYISGNVCAPKGFLASGMHCGIRRNKSKLDLALIYSEKRAAAAAVYTQNLVKGAPLYVCHANLEDGMAQAIVCNSGNANTCNQDGIEIAEKMCALTGAASRPSRRAYRSSRRRSGRTARTPCTPS
jgi:glutamate N-acetyltransferase/amino-acid N-acetyltransferase